MSIRSLLKAVLPRPIRDVLRACLHYGQRLGRWGIVLWQVRGDTWKDQWLLFKSAACAPLTALRDLQRWQDPILLDACTVSVAGVGRFSLRPHCDDLWHVLPWREQAISSLLHARLRAGDTFVDAGANIGIYTVIASRLVGDEGKVVSVEMMPDTADRLELHIRLNGLRNVQVVRKALSDVAGETVTAVVQPEKFGQASIAKDDSAEAGGIRVEVQTTTLDQVCEGLAAVRLMKIDLEGAERQALEGATSMLARLDAMVYESWGESRAVRNPVDELLERRGFVLSQLDGNNWLALRQSAP